MPRYVVLRHDTPSDYARPSHWDLMLEADGVLWTWALPDEPQLHQPLVAERLPDHRLAYLEYEGPISSGRGSVHRIMQGELTFKQKHDDCIAFITESGELPRHVRLARHADGQRWKVTFDDER